MYPAPLLLEFRKLHCSGLKRFRHKVKWKKQKPFAFVSVQNGCRLAFGLETRPYRHFVRFGDAKKTTVTRYVLRNNNYYERLRSVHVLPRQTSVDNDRSFFRRPSRSVH